MKYEHPPLKAAAKKIKKTDFGDGFTWGVSSSALQTEGACDADGKGPSIWDVFSKEKKKILNNDSPAVACNFYGQYKEDIALLKKLNIPNYRFSISWSRILPNGTGQVNQKGLDFYHKVIDACIGAGIEPWVTLYHWDLPAALQEQGGWTNRKIIGWFEEYVRVCVNAYKGKVKCWMVLNEPMVFTGAGYFLGVHAPGKKGLSNFLPAIHHAVMCQSGGARIIRQLQPDAQIGTTYSCSYVTPQTDSKRDKEAAKRIDALLNRMFIEPALGLGYPMETIPFLKRLQKYMKPGDEEKMIFDFDFIGIQNYTREVVSYTFYIPYLQAKLVPADKRKVFRTAMNWEVYPEAIYEMIKKFGHYKKVKKVIVTENGASFPDLLEDNAVNDTERINFLGSYLEQVLKAKQEGHKVEGYFVWSLTDNFEWAEGYHQRFGLIYVDFATQQRTVKKSGYWYRDFLK
ncbi:MAG: beta-glucosidase [Bacteroidetes bacterium]|jgi:beta-glucosidase|nr:beta-glucosidase [Bacteroidota bacterium]